MDTLQKGTTVGQLKMAYDEAKAYAVEVTYTELAKKVDKVTGKGLSTNDYTTDEKNKLSGIASGATKVTTDTVAGWGYTKNTGTVTSVAVKMNGSVKGTVTTNGTIDLGTVITAHQDISGKVNKTTTVNGHALSGNVTVTKSDVGLGNVGNFKAVSTAASQGLSDTEKSNARANIGAGTGNGTITGIKMNGASKGSSGVVDLGTVITAHQDISGKVNTSTKVNGHALTGDVTVSKTDVGLGNVTNDAQVKRTEMGVASGVATLDSAGKVPSSQLPSYVDDVLEYDTKSAFPATGEGGKIYVDKSNNTSWRWSGSAYTQIKGDLTIGTTSGTAADGKVVNDHINNTSNPHGVTKAQVGLGSVVNTGDSATPVSGGTTKFTTGGAYTELAKKVDKVSGKGLSTNDYTDAEKNKLSGIASGAEVNQNAFSNVVIGNTTISADGKTDTLTLVAGSNVTITPDATNDKITIAATDTTYSAATTSVAGLMSADDKTKLNGIATGATKVTTDTVAGWGYTKNAGTVTGVKINGTTKSPSSGVVDLGTVITAHQDISGKVDKVTGKGLSTNDYTTDEKNKLGGIASGAEVNQNAFSNVGVKVGNTTTTVAADAKTDTVTLIQGSNVTLTADTTNDTITIAAKDTTYSSKAAASGGSDVSLVTTGEKYIWNSKTSNTGTVTSVAVKMNGATKGTVTTSGTIDLGTVLTSHQDISGKVNKTTTVNGHALSGNVTVTKSDVGLGNVGNFKAVSTAASQGLTATERANARTNIAAVGETINKTWAELKSLRDKSQLVPGQWYRITDYVTTTIQEDTQSAGHVFDIIVRADNVNVLNENAYAALHAGDTYFAGCNLAAWKLRYTIDNIYWSLKRYTTYKIGSDTWGTAPSKGGNGYYRWDRSSAEPYYTESLENGATAYFNHGRMVSAGKTLSIISCDTEGFGTITWMKDENDNECPYDFKNIQFKVGAKPNPGTVAGVFYYTFSVATGTNDATITDHSLNGMYCRENKMGKYISNNNHQLNANVFRNTLSTNYCHSNTFGNNCYSNTFGNNCHSNTFRYNCHSNTFGNNCYSNTFGNDCYYNTFGNDCYYNTFGNSCYSNTFGNNCYSNTFGNGCRNNTFGNNCYSNTFGNSCYSNTFGNGCYSNTFRYSCYSNTFVNSCYSNTFGNNCGYINFQKYFIYYVIVENGNQHINVTSTQTTSPSSNLQNFTIAQGVNNSNTVKTISHNTVNDTFQTVYQPANSQVISV